MIDLMEQTSITLEITKEAVPNTVQDHMHDHAPVLTTTTTNENTNRDQNPHTHVLHLEQFIVTDAAKRITKHQTAKQHPIESKAIKNEKQIETNLENLQTHTQRIPPKEDNG